MARISGNSLTKVFIPKTECISYTTNPVGVLFSVWHGSRFKDYVDPACIQNIYSMSNEAFSKLKHNGCDYYTNLCKYLITCYPEYIISKDYSLDTYDLCNTRNIIKNVVKLVIKCDVPASEFVSFEFMTNDASVAWREQMVRNRRIHPWLQTSRTADMTTYDCLVMQSVVDKGEAAVNIYENAVDTIRTAYKQLIDLGVPPEDIRLQTQGHIHRCYWGLDLRNLIKLVGKRSSWIAQASLWLPVNSDISRYLRSVFKSEIIDEFLGSSPDITISDGAVVDYKYVNENEDRYYGKDYQPCDPLWLLYSKLSMPDHTDLDDYDRLKKMYINVWNDDTLKLLEWDRENPSKIGPFDRPASILESEYPDVFSRLKEIIQ